MGKNKQKQTEKKTAEFVLTTRPVDDPDYNNPNVPQNILLYKPKENDDENTQKALDKIPENLRGNTFDEETQARMVRQKLGIDSDNFDDKNKSYQEKIPNLIDENGNEENGMDFSDEDEVVDTKIKIEKREKKESKNVKEKKEKEKEREKIGFKSTTDDKKKEFENFTLKDLLSVNKEKLLEIDDKTLDSIMKKSKVKIDAELIEYNEFGLKKDINPEVLEFVTDKKFREGLDLFIPAPNFNEVMEQNRVDIDIDPEEMNPDYKEVFDALNDEANDNENEGGLEDDFILLANEGKLPIELLENEEKEEIVIIDTQKKEPSYKFITKEEKELMEKKFDKTYNQYYKNKELKEKDNIEEENEEYEEDELVKDKFHKTDLKSKQFKDAINEILPKNKRIEIKEDENEEEEAEFEEEEEFEEYDENLLDDEYMKKMNEGEMESNLKYSDKIVLHEKFKGKRGKNEILNKKFIVRNKKKEEEEETIEELEKYLYSKEVMEMEIKVIENMILRDEKEIENGKNQEDDDPAYELNYAKKYLDITSVGGTFENMPKIISIEGDPKKLQRKLRKDEKLKQERDLKEKEKQILKEIEKNKKNKLEKLTKKIKEKQNDLIDDDNSDDKDDLELDIIDEHKFDNKSNEKEENKLRKKLLKDEKKEKRKLKKEIKNSFKDEKVKQSKQIANTNSVIRYGISVKEI